MPDCVAERRGFELSVPLPHVGQTVPKRPLWDTFRTEKPKGFWVFSRVQTPFARQSFDFSPRPYRALTGLGYITGTRARYLATSNAGRRVGHNPVGAIDDDFYG